MRKGKIEKIEEDIKELTRRIDNLTTQLFTSDSEYGLHQIKEMKKKLGNLSVSMAINNLEIRIHSSAITSLQRAIYPLAEACEICKMNRKIRIMGIKTKKNSKI